MLAAPIFSSLVHAQPAYSSGVKVGDSVTFGNIVAIWNLNSTPPPGNFQQFNQSKSIQETVTSVSGSIVGASQTFTYKNGTQQTFNGTIDVQYGQGSLGYFILSGGLSTGDSIYQSTYPYPSFYPVITETVTKLYAGALRSINVVNQTDPAGGQRLWFNWDVKTGLLLDVFESLSYYYASLTLSFKVVSTSVWQPSTASDFGFDAIQESSLPLYVGETGAYKLVLNSTNSFHGIINLKPALLNSTQHGPTLSLSLTSVSVSADKSNSSILRFSTNASTPVGAYLFSVNGTSGGISHLDSILVAVSPPDFSLIVHPANLTISAGSSKTSTITISSLGVFSGSILLSVSTYSSITATIQPTNVTLSSTVLSANATLTVQVPAGTPPSQYDSVSVTGTSRLLSHSVNLPVNVTGPDFTMTANPPFLNMKPGTTAHSTITLRSVLGFSGTISLSTSAFQVSAFLDKTSVFVNSTTTATATLTVTVPINAQAGSDSVYVNGNTGVLYHSAYVNVNVTAPDFRITVTPSFFTLNEHSNATATISLLSSLGFHGTVSLSANVQYGNGLTVSVNPSSVMLAPNGTATSKLTLSTSTVNPGFYGIQVTGTSGSLSRTFFVSVDVIGPDFRIFANPSSLNMKAGTTAQSTITLSSILGFNGTVTLSASSYVVAASLNKNSVYVNSTTPATATLTVSVPGNTPTGYYNAYVSATAGNLTHSAYINVNVEAPSFSISVNPFFVTLNEGSSVNATITLTSIIGFQGPVSLSASFSSFNGPTFTINPSIVTLAANATATATLEISALTAVPGSYSVQITATSGNLYRFTDVSVSVVGPDFSMSPNPYNLNLPQGKSESSLVTISRIHNFNGTITLSSYFYGPTPGLTVSLNATTVTLSSAVTSATVKVTITASTISTPGFYNVEVVGNSTRLSRTAFIQVNLTPSPDFEIFASSPVDFNAGGQGTSTVTIVPRFGFTGNVNLTSSTTPITGLAVNCPSTIAVTNFTLAASACTLSSTTPGVYNVRIMAGSGSLSHNATFATYVGGFTISVKTPVDFDLGSSGQALVSITSTNRFVGNLTLTGSASGLLVNCPAVAGTSPDASIETICSVTGTVAGTYELTVTGSASPGSLSLSATAIVHVGDFTISTSSGSINRGASGTSITISLTSTLDFTGSVSLSSTIDPLTGLTVSCPATPVPLAPNSTSTASCILYSNSPDTYQVTVSGKATIGTASHNATSVIHVGDFAISVTPADVNSGSTGAISLSLTSINNFAGPISLSGSTTTGLTVTCPDAPTSITANSTITAFCTISSNTAGTYSVTITGVGTVGAASHSVSELTHVGDFTISISTPGNFDLGGPDGLISVNVTSKLNFASTIVLASSATPGKGLTVTCPALTLTANASASADCTFSAANAETYLVTITGSILPGTGSHSSSGVIQIVDFTVSASDISPADVATDISATSSITIAPINGFTGTLTLAVSPPSGLSCSFDHTTVESPGTSTLSCSAATSGDYKVVVTAIGESTFHQTSLTFHVRATQGAASSPTMFGLQLPQFFALVGGLVVAITVAGVTAVVRGKNRGPAKGT